jgi:pullulanase/glycogen debranching enzyme
LGAIWDGRGTNFALFSANAERVELCLLDSHGHREIERIVLRERTEDVWHGYFNDVAPGQSRVSSMVRISPSADCASRPASCLACGSTSSL